MSIYFAIYIEDVSKEQEECEVYKVTLVQYDNFMYTANDSKALMVCSLVFIFLRLWIIKVCSMTSGFMCSLYPFMLSLRIDEVPEPIYVACNFILCDSSV